ncbi:MAG: lysophospholipid acyltransferase family protein [Anaerolineae bacterium]|nr:MAG: lysophospholipid acyltransferase family protein [Anaerolineae bacterium]
MNYDHERLEGRRRILRWLIHQVGYRLLARFGRAENIENLPAHGSAIVIFNHIAFIDPIVVLSVLPRNAIPLARHDVFGIPGWGIFPRLWDVIPVRRDEVDRGALRKALAVLEAGEVLLVAPEGTRNPSLQRAKSGLAYLALKSGAPIVPVAIEGTKGYPTLIVGRNNLAPIVIRVGRPFQYKEMQGRWNHDRLRMMTDEAMYVLSEMLPEERRGVYSDLSHATTDTIEML